MASIYMPQPGDLASDPVPFVPQTLKPAVRFLSRGVQPPSQVYVTQSSRIVASCATSQNNETVTVSYRLLRADGQIVLGQFTVQPGSNRTPVAHGEQLAEGFLLSASCSATAAVTRGQTFVRIFITEAALGNNQPSYMLMADYVTTTMAPTHPNGRILAAPEGPGWRHIVVATPPGAGAPWSITCPVNARFRVRSILAAMTTDGTAGNRTYKFQTVISGGAMFRAIATATQAPSTTAVYSLSPLALTASLDAATIYTPMVPDLILATNGGIGAVQELGFPTDQWGGVQADVEEWLDNV